MFYTIRSIHAFSWNCLIFKFPWVGFHPFVLLTSLLLSWFLFFFLSLSFFLVSVSNEEEVLQNTHTHKHRQKCIFCVLGSIYISAMLCSSPIDCVSLKLWPNPYLGILTFYMVKICLNSNLINFLENSSLEFPWNTIFYSVGNSDRMKWWTV